MDARRNGGPTLMTDIVPSAPPIDRYTIDHCTNRDEWLLHRGSYIGGSDMAAILGIHPFGRHIGHVWLEKIERRRKAALVAPKRPSEALIDGKTGDVIITDEMEENRFTRWGKLLEPAILQAYAQDTGFAVKPLGLDVYRLAKMPYVAGTIDGEAMTPHGDLRLVEVKTTAGWNRENWGQTGSDQVPEHYLIQCMWYMIIRGIRITDVPVLIGGNDFRRLFVDFNPDLATAMLERVAQFWQLVESGTPPAIAYEAEGAKEFFQRLHSSISDTTKILPVRAKDLLVKIDEAEGRLEHFQGVIEAAEAELWDMVGEAQLATIQGMSPKLRMVRKRITYRKGYVVPDWHGDRLDSRIYPVVRKQRKELLHESNNAGVDAG